ncbi:hypothetical protein KUCAC02_036524, partial [Chaenocephalus aceratus]
PQKCSCDSSAPWTLVNALKLQNNEHHFILWRGGSLGGFAPLMKNLRKDGLYAIRVFRRVDLHAVALGSAGLSSSRASDVQMKVRATCCPPARLLVRTRLLPAEDSGLFLSLLEIFRMPLAASLTRPPPRIQIGRRTTETLQSCFCWSSSCQRERREAQRPPTPLQYSSSLYPFVGSSVNFNQVAMQGGGGVRGRRRGGEENKKNKRSGDEELDNGCEALRGRVNAFPPNSKHLRVYFNTSEHTLKE